MKKMLLALITLSLIPLASFAISLDELQSNSDEYVPVSQTQRSTTYVDKYSIDSLRYAPPYYNIKSTVYVVTYATDRILSGELTVSYDYNKNLDKTTDKIIAANPHISKAEYIAMLPTMDSGCNCTWENLTAWSFDGSILYYHDPIYNKMAEVNSSFYHAANYMFFQCYNQYFNPKLNSEKLY